MNLIRRNGLHITSCQFLPVTVAHAQRKGRRRGGREARGGREGGKREKGGR